MDRETFDRETALHRRVFEALRDQIQRVHAGKYVALAKGQLVVAAPTFEEARAAVECLSPAPEYYLIFPAEMEPAFELSRDF
jgi:hypothetical protein